MKGEGSFRALVFSHQVSLASPHTSTPFPTLQAPHRAAREQGFLPDSSGVYISRWHHGSPSHRYGLFALHFIAEVNGQKTPDLETFLQVGVLLLMYVALLSPALQVGERWLSWEKMFVETQSLPGDYTCCPLLAL